MSFADFWYGRGGIPGDYDYGLIHIISIFVIIAVSIILGFFAWKKGQIFTRKTIIVLSIFFIFFEIFWRILFLSLNMCGWRDIWPLYPCNLAGIIVPIAALTKSKYMKKMFYLFAFLGGIVTFIMPQGIFANAYLNFPILKSILQHAAIIIIPVIEYSANIFRPKLKDTVWIFIGLIIHAINSELISLLLDKPGDYMFFRSGLPFVIPGIPSFITISIFALAVIYLFLALLDINGIKDFINSKRSGKKAI